MPLHHPDTIGTGCPWCLKPVSLDDTIQERNGVIWHARCKDQHDTQQRRAARKPNNPMPLVCQLAGCTSPAREGSEFCFDHRDHHQFTLGKNMPNQGDIGREPKPQSYVNGDKLPTSDTFAPGWRCPSCSIQVAGGQYHDCKGLGVPPTLIDALGREMDKVEEAHTAHLTKLLQTPAPTLGPVDPLAVQIGGDHYKSLPIQPMEYSMKNKLDACQHTIVKYVTRFRSKGGIQDLEKAKHCIDMLIAFEKAKP